jgi:hypothetical protein
MRGDQSRSSARALIFVLPVLAFSVAACGPASSGPSPSPKGSSSTPATVAPAAVDPPQASVVMSVPFGLYAASSWNGSRNVSIGSMRMHADATYTMLANAYGSGIVDPEKGGQKGAFNVVSDVAIGFSSGAYVGLTGKLYPNYKGHTYIDVLLANGTKQSYQYVNP